jgi:cytochrome b6-f complex iron-sulfur subunit
MSLEAEPAVTTWDGGDVSRRQVLNYAWLASLGILLIEGGIVSYRFAMPQVAAGELGGPMTLGPVDSLPAPGGQPLAFTGAMFWWVATERGALAIYKVCTHLGCICEWSEDRGRFVCPCHGSEFTREGDLVGGPAPRGLDRMIIRAYDASGRLVAGTGADGAPLLVPPGATVVVDTGEIAHGPPA